MQICTIQPPPVPHDDAPNLIVREAQGPSSPTEPVVSWFRRWFLVTPTIQNRGGPPQIIPF